MVRLYVPSTPASRGEDEFDEAPVESLLPPGLSHDEMVAALERVAAELGYSLEPIEPEDESDGADLQVPAGNASREDWVAFAEEKHGVKPEDLVDDKGEPLGRDAIRDKFTPSS